MKFSSTKSLTRAGMIAALYAALTLIFQPISYGPIQLRVSEALTLLPFLYPGSVWGLFIGCIVTNIISPYGVLDMIFGSLATLLAGALTAKAPNRYLAALPPVLCNMLIIGAVIAYQEAGFTAAFAGLFGYHALTIGLGQTAVCCALGLPLLRLVEKKRLFDR